MYFEILGEITQAETIATGSGIREIGRLRKRYGRGRWRKRKGIAEIRLQAARLSEPRCTGMRQAGSGNGNSRSSASFEVKAYG